MKGRKKQRRKMGEEREKHRAEIHQEEKYEKKERMKGRKKQRRKMGEEREKMGKGNR